MQLTERFFREKTLYLACNEECIFFFISDVYKKYNLWSCQKVCDALVYLLDNIFIRFGTYPYRQTVGLAMGTNQAAIIETFNSTRWLWLQDTLMIY